jgi:hypothetical protein
MNVYYFLNYKLPADFLKQLYNFDYPIIQINPNNTDDIRKYLNEDKYSNLINKIKDIDTNNKEIFIKLLLLYINGGLVINDKIVLSNIYSINELYKNNDLTVIRSCLYNKLFSGLIISKKNNRTIIDTLNEFFENNQDNLSIETLLFKNIQISENNIILNEQIIDNISYIYNGETIIAEHHFVKAFLLELYKKKICHPSDLKKIKIGITIDIPNNLKSFYSNGIRQNVLYFFELLKNMNYDVTLILSSNYENVLETIDFYKYNYIKLENIFNEEFDIIFSFGFSLPSNVIDILKKMGVKIVAYFCGNSYIIDSEKILYNQHTDRTISYINTEINVYEQIWSIPQMYKQNKYYWEIIHKTKCIEVPFIWSPNSINFIKKILNIDSEEKILYKKKYNKIAVFEPNLSLMKWSLPCILISELTHRKYKNIEHLYITNIELDKKPEDMKINNFNNTEFNNLCKCFDLFHNKKISAEKRYVTLDFMSNFADIAISHQWENPLNYLYLDLAWMGWPILHNAHLCKDVGYY